MNTKRKILIYCLSILTIILFVVVIIKINKQQNNYFKTEIEFIEFDNIEKDLKLINRGISETILTDYTQQSLKETEYVISEYTTLPTNIQETKTSSTEVFNNQFSSEKMTDAASKKTVTAKTTFNDITTKEITKTNQENKASNQFLFSIKNPDPNYKGVIMKVEDRKNLEGLVMAEFGENYEGMVFVAQAIRDTMLKTGIRNTATIKQKYGYTPPIRKNVSNDCKRAVAYVFDEGNSAVQHPIHVFYATKYAKSKWHETQKFVFEWRHVRFFAMWHWLK